MGRRTGRTGNDMSDQRIVVANAPRAFQQACRAFLPLPKVRR
jgi:hypothetical protein